MQKRKKKVLFFSLSKLLASQMSIYDRKSHRREVWNSVAGVTPVLVSPLCFAFGGNYEEMLVKTKVFLKFLRKKILAFYFISLMHSIEIYLDGRVRYFLARFSNVLKRIGRKCLRKFNKKFLNE